ncbi:MAG: hypothetical protein FWH48_10460, partial [Oscillospiraceae bacterium]|nr:hypothetical protein [Oscillospiraceae bacterium]
MKTAKFYSKLVVAALFVAMIVGLFSLTAMAVDQYNSGDVEIINNMIDKSNIGWPLNDPDNWTGVTWSNDGRITELTIGSMTLIDNVDLSELTALEKTTVTGNINLMGYTFTVPGDYEQTNGNLTLNGGRLEISGDYTITNGNLFMTNEKDYMLVGGSFETSSPGGSPLSNGMLEIKGNFTENGTANNFSASGNHTTLFTGETPPTISFAHPTNGFGRVEFETKSAVMLTAMKGCTLLNDLTLLTGSTNDFGAMGGTLDLMGYTLIVPGNFTSSAPVNLKGGKMTVEGDLIITGGIDLGAGDLKGDLKVVGDFATNAGVNLNGGTMAVGGGYEQTNGNLTLNGGHLEIEGDYTISDGNLFMTNEKDYMLV